VAIRAAEAQRACRVHGRLIGLRVAGNASGAFAVGFLLRLAHQVWTGLLLRRSQRWRGESRGYRGEEQAHAQSGPWRGMREPNKDIAIFHPAIHSAFRGSANKSQVLSFRAKRGISLRFSPRKKEIPRRRGRLGLTTLRLFPPPFRNQTGRSGKIIFHQNWKRTFAKSENCVVPE
jgi:hypothetical protein